MAAQCELPACRPGIAGGEARVPPPMIPTGGLPTRAGMRHLADATCFHLQFNVFPKLLHLNAMSLKIFAARVELGRKHIGARQGDSQIGHRLRPIFHVIVPSLVRGNLPSIFFLFDETLDGNLVLIRSDVITKDDFTSPLPCSSIDSGNELCNLFASFNDGAQTLRYKRLRREHRSLYGA